MSAVIKHGTMISLFLALACCGCFQKPRQQLVVGMELNYPPFEMIDPQGRPAGLSVEMAEALGQVSGTAGANRKHPLRWSHSGTEDRQN